MIFLTYLKGFLLKIPLTTWYIIIIIILSISLIFSFIKRPKESIKTEIQTVTKIEYRDRQIANNIQKKIVTLVAKDGSKQITETISNTSKIADSDIIKTKDVIQKKDVEIYQNDYIASVLYPVSLTSLVTPFDPSTLQVTVGRRIFSLPVFVDLGTTGKFNSVSIGFTIEL
jgi:hypothetical protein